MSVLISAADLASLLGQGATVRLLDVRWSLASPDGSVAYAAGHLPGAVYVSLETELSAHGEPADGRHPLPTREHLEVAARRWGLNDGDLVVVYDDGPAIAAARAWWLLRHAGVDVRILDGGLAAWKKAGFRVDEGVVTPEPGSIALGWGALATIDIDEAAAYPVTGLLLDARAAERYRGDVEPVDPIAGHIPGAVNAPTAENVGPDGRFLAAEQLAERFAALGADHSRPIAVYCGSGVTAGHEIAALAIAGIDAALYPGSWSQWSNTPGRPVETGSGSPAAHTIAPSEGAHA